MARNKQVVATTPEAAAVGSGSLRRCIGSAKFGIEAHEASVEDFPVQPSQKDGLGRMCKPHWSKYTAGLARDAKARKAADGTVAAEAAPIEAEPVAAKVGGGRKAKKAGAAKPEPIKTRAPRGRPKAKIEAEVAQETSAG